jgi:hypothetical protein
MRRFIILAQGASGSEPAGRKITRALKAKGVAYWHHIANGWLVVDSKERTHKWWHHLLRPCVGAGGRLVIVNVDGGTHSARGPGKMFPWLRSTWRDED